MAPGGQGGQILGGDAFGPPTIPVLKGHAEPRPQQKRIEELFAKLAVPDPVFVLAIAAKRKGIDEDGPRAEELDVVGRGIGQGDVVVQKRDLDVEMGKGRGLEGTERPFVRVGPKGNFRMFENDSASRRVFAQLGAVDLFTADHHAARDQRRQGVGIPYKNIIVECDGPYRAKNPAMVHIDLSGRVPKGCWVNRHRRVCVSTYRHCPRH